MLEFFRDKIFYIHTAAPLYFNPQNSFETVNFSQGLSNGFDKCKLHAYRYFSCFWFQFLNISFFIYFSINRWKSTPKTFYKKFTEKIKIFSQNLFWLSAREYNFGTTNNVCYPLSLESYAILESEKFGYVIRSVAYTPHQQW